MMQKQTQKQQPRVEKEIRAEAFILVDSEGRERAHIEILAEAAAYSEIKSL